MNYKDEMRKLINLVKQQSFDAPLESTLEDLTTLSTAETAIKYTAECYNAFENRNALGQLTTAQIERYQSNKTGQ